MAALLFVTYGNLELQGLRSMGEVPWPSLRLGRLWKVEQNRWKNWPIKVYSAM